MEGDDWSAPGRSIYWNQEQAAAQSSFVQAAIWEELENQMQVWTRVNTFLHCFIRSMESSAVTMQSCVFAGCMSKIMKGD